MEIGTGLITCQRRPDDNRSATAIYDEMLKFAMTAESFGLDSVWVSEHHFSEDEYMPSVMPALSAIATATDEIGIGTYVALAPLYDAVRFAEDTATVSLISDGRLITGLANGYRDEEFEAFGVPMEERVPRTEEVIEVLQGSWSGGPLNVDTKFHEVSSDTVVTPKPDDPPRILLGGTAPPAVKRAASIADGWGAPAALSIEGVRKRHEHIHEVREQAGLDDDFTFIVSQYGFVADSKEAAWEQMRDGYLHVQRKYEEWFSGESIDRLPADRRKEVKEQAIFGSPAEVVEQLETYRDALGDDIHFLFRTYYPGIDTAEMLRSVELLGDEVVPELR